MAFVATAVSHKQNVLVLLESQKNDMNLYDYMLFYMHMDLPNVYILTYLSLY